MDVLIGAMVSFVSMGLVTFMVSAVLQLSLRKLNFLWFLFPLFIILLSYSLYNQSDFFYTILILAATGGAGLIQFLFFVRKFTDRKIAEYMNEK